MYLLFIDSTTAVKLNPKCAHEDGARVFIDLNNIQYISKAHTLNNSY